MNKKVLHDDEKNDVLMFYVPEISKIIPPRILKKGESFAAKRV